MAAYRQAKRMQRGVLMAQGGFSTTDPALRQGECTIQCILIADKIAQTNSSIFSLSTATACLRLSYNSNILELAVSRVIKLQEIELNKVYNVVFSLGSINTSVYINGSLLFTAPTPDSSIRVLYQIGYLNTLRFDSIYLAHRHFNYAMTADEIATLYNNGDPMGYVVPKAMRNIPELPITNSNIEFDISSPFSYMIARTDSFDVDRVYEIKYTIDEYEFDPDDGIRWIGGNNVIPSGMNMLNEAIKDGLGVIQTCYISIKAGNSAIIYAYGGNIEYSVRKLKLTILSLRPQKLLAEYLPQNLMYGRDDNSIATSWLDSAKQLPLSDEYMEPLFQSVGGYDMAANGAPEILYNE